MAGIARLLELAALSVLTFSLAVLLRYDFEVSAAPWPAVVAWLPLVAAVRIVVFATVGGPRWIWQSVTMHDLFLTARAVGVGTGLLLLASLAGRAADLDEAAALPWSVIVVDGGMLLLLIGGIRVGFRVLSSRTVRGRVSRRVLIVGAGESGIALASQMRNSPLRGLRPAAFADDNPQKQGRIISGIRVAGSCEEIPTLVAAYGINLVIIAMPSATPERIRTVIGLCQESGAPFRIVPSPLELVDGAVSLQRVRDIDVADLLARPTAHIDHGMLLQAVQGKRVLVTGAGGSVGSELVRQVKHLRPAALALLDHSENSLFFVDAAVRASYPLMDVCARIVDLTVLGDVQRVMADFRPEVVFHAAAHKHVGLMEDVPGEAVRNNIGGTLVLAEAAAVAGVEVFVFVSTDKAVAPKSVMGATKAVCEAIVQEIARRSSTRFITVRFGNVLGSNGSVVPIFQQQIADGGPVTITHPDMERYFMTTPEAAGLILEASAVGQSGDVCVLDMGEPLKIVALAETMIRLSGHVPYEGVPIVFTGARPGEKLTEELVLTGGTCEPTPYEKLLLVKEPAYRPVIAEVRALLEDLPALDADAARSRLWTLLDCREARLEAVAAVEVRPAHATPATLQAS